jgi:hypothetical protein
MAIEARSDTTEAPRELAERESKPIALAWIASAIAALERLPGCAIARAALGINFAWKRAGKQERSSHLRWILDAYRRSEEVLLASDLRFRSATEEEARRCFPAPTPIPPAYAIFGRHVHFTPGFMELGPMCRAAIVLHESVHVFDARSGEPEIHVSEWDEPRFSRLSPAQAIHNPSSYASFAAQVHAGKLSWPQCERFGAGRPDD